jgi:hypothetical protein
VKDSEEQKFDPLIARLESRTYRSSQLKLMVCHMSALLSLLKVIDNGGHNMRVMTCRCNGKRVPEDGRSLPDLIYIALEYASLKVTDCRSSSDTVAPHVLAVIRDHVLSFEGRVGALVSIKCCTSRCCFLISRLHTTCVYVPHVMKSSFDTFEHTKSLMRLTNQSRDLCEPFSTSSVAVSKGIGSCGASLVRLLPWSGGGRASVVS